MSQNYVRVKVEKSTIFLYVEANETVQSLKYKVAQILGNAAFMQVPLFFNGQMLADQMPLANYEVYNDAVLELKYQ